MVVNGDFPTEMLEMLAVFIPSSHESAIKDIYYIEGTGSDGVMLVAVLRRRQRNKATAEGTGKTPYFETVLVNERDILPYTQYLVWMRQ